MTISVKKGYLALRYDTAYGWTNEMGQFLNGSKVIVIGEVQGDYVMVQVVSQTSGYWTNITGCAGYVNKNSLKAAYLPVLILNVLYREGQSTWLPPLFFTLFSIF